jgi:alpha-beta hydrolase superfamily lysophospholipase
MADIVLIHGAWLSARSWENFEAYFTQRGYNVEAPEWPRKHGDVEALRESADELKGLGIQEIVDHYDELIRGRDPQPVIMGHSFGGLFTLLLLDRGLGSAGVALEPAQPKGVLGLAPSTLKAAAPAIAHPSKLRGVVTLTPEQFNYGFTNTWPADEAKAVYERYAVPETGRIFFQDGLANFHWHSPATIDFKKSDRAPLLITVGEHDHIVPSSSARGTFKKYEKSDAVTDFVEFPGRSHLVAAGAGWEEVAKTVGDWVDGILPGKPAATAGA